MRLLAFAFLITLLLPATAMAQECPRSTVYPTAVVKTRQDTPQLITNVDINGLRSLRNAPESAGGGSEHVPLGLAKAEVTYQISMQAQITPLRNGSFCVNLKQADIEYAFANTAIYVASEVPKGSCIFSKVEEHERQHVSVDGQLLREWQFRLQQDADAAVRGIGTIWNYSQEQALEDMKSRIRTSLQETAKYLLAERARRQAQVDTRMEYDRIARSCNGEAQTIVRRALGY